MYRSFYTRFISSIFVFSIAVSGLQMPAQSRRPARPGITPVKSEIKAACKGGWSGIVTFAKTLKDSFESDEPGIRKNIDRIQHRTSRDYNYYSRTIVDGSDPRSTLVNSKVNFEDKDLQWGQEKVFDTCNSRESGHWFIIEGTDDRHTQAQAEGSARSFNLSVNELEGNYSFNVAMPDAKGVFKREEHVRRSGHCQPKNNEPYDRSTNEPYTLKGESFSISGEKIDPNDPDHLSGTKIWGDDGKGAVRPFIYTVTWRFTRCPEKLLITELRYEHPKFPDYENWQEIPESIGTIDGNRIKIRAKVLNLSAETKYAELKLAETYKGDRYNGARADEVLPEGESSLRLDPGEEREVEYVWDSEGQSWFDDGRPHLTHRLKATLSENGVKKDEKEKPVNIAPKPLILVHGVWSDYRVWEPLYQNLLTLNHSYQWKAFPVGNVGEGRLSTGNAFLSGDRAASVYENADSLARYIKYAQRETNAWHVDMVAHSTGGLIARLYMHKLMPNVPDARPQVKHLVMLGTPNGGMKCADVFVGLFDRFKEKLQPVSEFTNDAMLRFNQFVVNTGGTKFSALAGNSVPVICGGYEWNDGFVTVKSAKYGISDTGDSNDLNLQLVDGKNFSNFVKPHLVTGPDRKYPLSVKNDPSDIDRWKLNGAAFEYTERDPYAGLFANVSTAAALPGNASVDAVLAAHETRDLDLTVAAAANLAVTFMADPSITASLIDESGAIVRRDAARSPLAGMTFRTLFYNRPVTGGRWRLRVENTSDSEKLILAVVGSNGPPARQTLAE